LAAISAIDEAGRITNVRTASAYFGLNSKTPSIQRD
jgi:hypothetical protein